MVTGAAIFLRTLYQAGVTHAFVNWGNDHPAFLEELERQRVESGDKASTQIKIVTCPNEMVALSAAHAFTLVTHKPALVIVHVDVGTQALAGAVHNADRGRAPVLIFSGASPFSGQGELKGSKNEWPMWLQDVPDQAAIVRQYMRYTAQLQSGRNIGKMVLRALQIATSDVKGPVYLYARREVLDEEVDEPYANAAVDIPKWPSIQPSALTSSAVSTIIEATKNAKFPLLIVAHSGRNPRTVPLLSELSDTLNIALHAASPSTVCVPSSHPHFLGTTFVSKNPYLARADVIIILDTEVPWVDMTSSIPRKDARIFVIDPDPLKVTMGWSHVDAELICRGDSEAVLTQLVEAARSLPEAVINDLKSREHRKTLKEAHDQYITSLRTLEDSFQESGIATVPNILGVLRQAVQSHTPSKGDKTLWLNEAITNYGLVFEHLGLDRPGSILCSGGTSLGWALGGAVGALLASSTIGDEPDLAVVIVGDGTFLFGVPSSAYWIARRCNTPFLTIVLNNGGWAAPKYSMLGIYPEGHGSRASGTRLSVGFGPDMPDYGQIAAGAGGAWSRRTENVQQAREAIAEGIKVVLNEKRCAVVDCIVESI